MTAASAAMWREIAADGSGVVGVLDPTLDQLRDPAARKAAVIATATSTRQARGFGVSMSLQLYLVGTATGLVHS